MDKDYILKEIDRTAKKNGGKPLGQGRFAKETGIKVREWLGRYWARWGDALIEAGYHPNEWVSAYDENWLLMQIVDLIREKGRFPTRAEFEMKSYNTPGFPNYGTIRNRLGTYSQQVDKVITYCEAHPEFSDVLELCRNVPRTLKKESPVYSKEDGIAFGFVYLMKSGRYYKIGCSSNVERRKYDLGIKLPERVDILHKIATDDPTGIEDYWQNRFKEKRKQGEWFDLSKEDISDFKRRKFM